MAAQVSNALGRPTSWRQVEGGTYQLRHPGYAVYGTVKEWLPEGAPSFVAPFIWEARVMLDCRLSSLDFPGVEVPSDLRGIPVQGRAHTLEEAQAMVEAVLVGTRTIPREELPSKTSESER